MSSKSGRIKADMQPLPDKTIRMLLETEEEIFNQALGEDHPFRKLNETLNFEILVEPLRELYSILGQHGVPVTKGFKCLLLQFWEDYSDRQMEKAVRENFAIRWFCGFSISEDTPSYSYFCKLRARIGAERIAEILNTVNQELRDQGLFGNVFHFVDASSLISKMALWEERDQAIKDGEEKLNNAVVSKYAKDKDAKWGAKSKNNIWFGFKRHVTVDMRHGLIEKTTVTPANVPDFKVLDGICPEQGMVFMDKLYDCSLADEAIQANGCVAGTIRKKNNQSKNPELDKWRSKVRMPFEGTFNRLSKRTRYRGLPKVMFQNIMEVISYNLKKAVVILPTTAVPT